MMIDSWNKWHLIRRSEGPQAPGTSNKKDPVKEVHNHNGIRRYLRYLRWRVRWTAFISHSFRVHFAFVSYAYNCIVRGQSGSV